MLGRRLLVVAVTLAAAACSTPRTPESGGQDGGGNAALESCTGCHGNAANGNAAPPVSATGNASTADVRVGAHQQHLKDSGIRQAVACSDCHVVPATVDAPGHIDQDRATLTWSALAQANGTAASATRSPDGTTLTCSVYCHGASFAAANGTNHAPSWTVLDGSQAGCGTCHGIPPPPPHPATGPSMTTCGGCHPHTVKPDGTIDVAGGAHINGTVDFAGTGTGCTACHGDPNRQPAAIAPAPPQDTKGNTGTSSPGVGAHQRHLAGGSIRAGVPCTECHVVPSDAQHASQPLNLTWGTLARSDGATPSFSTTALTCANYCHGQTLGGGTLTAPVWTQGASQAACGTCHGLPPPASTGHPAVGSSLTGCAGCHPATVKSDGTIDVAGGKHVNGTVDVAGGTCTTCHGDANRTPSSIAAAPPKDTKGNTATTAPGVGAHQQHLTAGPLASAFPCSECHTVPTNAAHATQPLDLTWGPLAKAGGVTPTFDANTNTCTNACHGAALQGGSKQNPVWNAGAGEAACGTCHGIPPPTGQHATHFAVFPSCGACHDGYTNTTVNTANHVNGQKDVGGTGTYVLTWTPPTCTATCHSAGAVQMPWR